MGWASKESEGRVQVFGDYVLIMLLIERAITYSIVVAKQVLKRSGFNFLGKSKPIIPPSTDK
jgi:hypothetical protein